jgi:cyclopropane-fatty-acyl-phospholipid synthase
MNRWDDAAKLYDERFCRMWEFYLAGSEMGFRADGHLVMQFQLTRDQQAVPLTRDYLYANRPVSDAHVSDCYSDRRVA